MEVVSVNKGAPQSAIDKIRKSTEDSGGIFELPTRSSPYDHPDVHLYDKFKDTEGFDVIGISHKDGPCDTCKEFLENAGFYDAYFEPVYR